MKVEIGENNCLLVFLDKAEVRSVHLVPEQAAQNDEAARRIIACIYRDAARQVGFEPAAAAGQVTELLPFADGSVLLCFSFKKVRQKLKVRARCKHHYALYHFGSRADLSAFLGAARRWAQLPDAVYESEGAYRVLYRNPARQTENLLKEYAQRLSLPFALQRTAEYWHALEYGECRD